MASVLPTGHQSGPVDDLDEYVLIAGDFINQAEQLGHRIGRGAGREQIAEGFQAFLLFCIQQKLSPVRA